MDKKSTVLWGTFPTLKQVNKIIRFLFQFRGYFHLCNFPNMTVWGESLVFMLPKKKKHSLGTLCGYSLHDVHTPLHSWYH